MFTQMLRIREFEERVKRTFEEHPGVIRGHTHLADGAEASIVGSLAAIGPDDYVLATYRCHGYPIVLGTDPKAMMAEIYGRSDGLCKGYGGSMHLTDVERGFLGTSGIVGQGIPHATGAAYAAQIEGKGRVVLSFFGDGASKQGAFHESLNVASLWKLPIVYVMENNSYNVVTRVEQEDANAAAGRAARRQGEGVQHAGRDRRRRRSGRGARAGGRGGRARAFGRRADAGRVARLPAERPRQHHRAAGRPAPLPRARGDRGLRCDRGVRGRDARRPRPALPREARHRRDAERGAEADELAAAARDEMAAAVAFGVESPFPAAEDATRYVYA